MTAASSPSDREEGSSSRLPPLSSSLAMQSPVRGDAASSSLTRLPSAAAKNDVTLPCIRSLGAFEGESLPPIRPSAGPSAEVLPPPQQQYASSSSSSLPPLPKFADPRSRADGVKNQLPPPTHRRGSPPSPALHPDHAQSDSSQGHYWRSTITSDGAPPFQHPFFDRKPQPEEATVATYDHEDPDQRLMLEVGLNARTDA